MIDLKSVQLLCHKVKFYDAYYAYSFMKVLIQLYEITLRPQLELVLYYKA